MKITKNGFYNLSQIKEKNIEILDNLNIVFFDESNNSRKIIIGNNSIVEVYSFLNNIAENKIEVDIVGKNSKLQMGFLLFSDKEEIKSKIITEIGSNSSSSEVKILSIVGNNGIIDLNAIMQINKGLSQVKGHLNQDNLFIGNKGKIKAIPSLLVRTNDVEASHSCRVEKISDEKLFYLRSRGIEKENALYMMIESYIKSLYYNLKIIDEEFYNKTTEIIIDLITKK